MNNLGRSFEDLMRTLNDIALKDSDIGSEIRAKVAEDLGKLGSTRAITQLLVLLEDRDEDEEVRVRAAQSLANLQADEAVDPLRRIVEGVIYGDSGENAVAYYAIGALATLNNIGTVLLLIDACGHRDVGIRKAACNALVQFGEPAVMPLIEALINERRPDHWYIVTALGRIGDSRGINSVAQVLGDTSSDRYVRAAAAEALGRLGGKDSFELLARTYQAVDEDELVRRGAVTGLGLTRDPRAFDLLIDASNSKNPSIRWDAATALGFLGDPRANKPLIAMLEDKVQQVRLHAAEALGRIGDETAIIPLQNLQNNEPDRLLAPLIIKRASDAIDHIRKR